MVDVYVLEDASKYKLYSYRIKEFKLAFVTSVKVILMSEDTTALLLYLRNTFLFCFSSLPKKNFSRSNFKPIYQMLSAF